MALRLRITFATPEGAPAEPTYGQHWVDPVSGGLEYVWYGLWNYGGDDVDQVFPSEPNVGQRHEHGDKQWIWHSTGWAFINHHIDVDHIMVDTIVLKGIDLTEALEDLAASIATVISNSLSTEEEATAGEDNTTLMTPLRTKQAIIGNADTWATQQEAEAGAVDDKLMSPLRVSQEIVAKGGGFLFRQVILTSATVTIPVNAHRGFVRMLGAGGGYRSTTGGYCGGYLEKFLTGLTPGLALTATVSNARAGYEVTGGDTVLASGTQSISTLTAKGGDPWGNPGTATGGDWNVTGYGRTPIFFNDYYGFGGWVGDPSVAGGPGIMIIDWLN